MSFHDRTAPSGRTAWAAAALVVAASLGSSVANAQAPVPMDPPVDPRDAAQSVHQTNDYPSEVNVTDGQGSFRRFPARGDESDEERRQLGRSGRTDLDDHDARDGRDPAEPERGVSWMPNLSGLAGLGKIVIYILLGLGGLALLGLLAYLVYNVWPRGGTAPDDEARPSAVPILSPDGLPFEAGDPDALAAAGRYDEAILALLVRALRSVGWAPSTEGSRTAREVLWGLGASDPRRIPLRVIVDGAERVRFAGSPATREVFEALRPHLDSVRAAERGEAA